MIVRDALKFPLRRLEDYYPVVQQLLLSCSDDLKDDFNMLLSRMLPVMERCKSLLTKMTMTTEPLHLSRESLKTGLPGRPNLHIDVDAVRGMQEVGMNLTTIADRQNVSRNTLMTHEKQMEIRR